MVPLTLGEVAAIVGGALYDADPGAVVTGPVEFDSRRVSAGGLFLAFPGEHADGHAFVPAAVGAGALAALVSRPVEGPRIEVPDVLGAVGRLAAAAVRRLPDLTVIGVTGSSGKTSTKDLLAQVLARAGVTVAPPGSFNNELGHPYTVLRADERTRFLVLETSARGVGHIKYLGEIAPPRIGVVLNVGSAHLGEFGSRGAIAQAKGELVEALPADGVAVLNADDPLVAAMAHRTPARVVTVGLGPSAAIRAVDVNLDSLGRAAFALDAGRMGADVHLRLVGAHHVGNALAAAAVALECGMALDEVAAALSDAVPVSRWRMEVTERADGVVIVNDAYNANPESMGAALNALAAIARERGARSVAVLGHMAELGDSAAAEHEALGRLADELAVSRVIAVGEFARPILDGAGGDASWVADVDEAMALLNDELRAGDVVLVKASRSAGLERVALALAGEPA